MERLFRKSGIWFAVLWIVVYVAGVSIADSISVRIGMDKAVTLPFLLILSGIALHWLRRNARMQEYGLCRTNVPAVRFLYYIPLAAIVSCNLWFGVLISLSSFETVLHILSMCCVGFLEEIIFRGFLFKAMSHDDIRSAIIVSSVTFGIGHIVNLINGSGASLLSNTCQVIYAMAFGFLFVTIFRRSGSLLPCILAHGLLNALSVFRNDSVITPEIEVSMSLILAATAMIYALFLIKTLPIKE